ncbi:hypothetical protein Trydic_g5257 [Trypoxylus dichotomus]
MEDDKENVLVIAKSRSKRSPGELSIPQLMFESVRMAGLTGYDMFLNPSSKDASKRKINKISFLSLWKEWGKKIMSIIKIIFGQAEKKKHKKQRQRPTSGLNERKTVDPLMPTKSTVLPKTRKPSKYDPNQFQNKN